MINSSTANEVRSQSQPALAAMRSLFAANRSGNTKGIYATCSAHPLVLESAFEQAKADNSLVLIEATCNQVNQQGGYTGMTPSQFRQYVDSFASRKRFPQERLVLGGDHLGPNPWRSLPSSIAMEKACELVMSYARAGFKKIHLDASMPCSDDERVLSQAEIARRAASLCRAADMAVADLSQKPVYVIGTEVPTPGGSQHELEGSITTTESLEETLSSHRAAFAREGLEDAWERVVAVVVQPGVEFGNDMIADYNSASASELTAAILHYPDLIFEAHSTDYQTLVSLRRLVADHFGILKVGPELTFALREAIFGLACIEQESVAEHRRSHVRGALEHVMLEHPEGWNSHYHGSPTELRVSRAFSLSDRIRYYWPNAQISNAVSVLIENLRQKPATLSLLGQFLPRQSEAVRAGTLQNSPKALIRHAVRYSLQRYAEACGSAN
jgi:D-tagatose-1,6-bisphosphate aldolase subunit GatZ/KbaZ